MWKLNLHGNCIITEMTVEVAEDYYNATLAFEDDAFNIALSPFTYREDSLEEVKEEISNVTHADDNGA